MKLVSILSEVSVLYFLMRWIGRDLRVRRPISYPILRVRQWQNLPGRIADPGEYPFFAVSSPTINCGSSLIHDDMILTAAHCFSSFREGIAVGAYDRSQGGDGEEKQITLQIPYPYYDDSIYYSDIMVLKLASRSNQQQVQINTDANTPSTGDVVTVCGMGLTTEEGSVSTILREVDVFVVDFETCNQQYDDTLYDNTVICAGVSGGGKGRLWLLLLRER